MHYLHNNVLVIDQSEYIEDRPVPGPFPAFPMTKMEKPWERGWGGGGGGGVWPLHYQRFCAHCMQYAFINKVCTSNTLQKHKLNSKVFKSQVCLGEMTPL